MLFRSVDENGEPLVVYHGTDAEFTVFDTDEESDVRQGHVWSADYPDGTIFLTSDKNNAKYYGKNIMPLFVSLPDPQIVEVKDGDSLVKPIDDGGLAFYGDVMVRNKRGDVVIATNYERAVKSATDNVGTFGVDNPDIRYSKSDVGGFEEFDDETPDVSRDVPDEALPRKGLPQGKGKPLVFKPILKPKLPLPKRFREGKVAGIGDIRRWVSEAMGINVNLEADADADLDADYNGVYITPSDTIHLRSDSINSPGVLSIPSSLAAAVSTRITLIVLRRF